MIRCRSTADPSHDKDRYSRLLTYVKLLLQDLDGANLHYDIDICAILPGERKYKDGSARSRHTDLYPVLGGALDSDTHLLALLWGVGGDLDVVNVNQMGWTT